MLKIWYGRENSDREKFIYESIEKDGGLAMVIVPDQYTLEAERQAFRYMNSGVLMDVEVLSLSRLGQRLLKKTGLDRFTFIDRYGRYMLLSRIVSEKAWRFQRFIAGFQTGKRLGAPGLLRQ